MFNNCSTVLINSESSTAETKKKEEEESCIVLMNQSSTILTEKSTIVPSINTSQNISNKLVKDIMILFNDYKQNILTNNNLGNQDKKDFIRKIKTITNILKSNKLNVNDNVKTPEEETAGKNEGTYVFNAKTPEEETSGKNEGKLLFNDDNYNVKTPEEEPTTCKNTEVKIIHGNENGNDSDNDNDNDNDNKIGPLGEINLSTLDGEEGNVTGKYRFITPPSPHFPPLEEDIDSCNDNDGQIQVIISDTLEKIKLSAIDGEEGNVSVSTNNLEIEDNTRDHVSTNNLEIEVNTRDHADTVTTFVRTPTNDNNHLYTHFTNTFTNRRLGQIFFSKEFNGKIHRFYSHYLGYLFIFIIILKFIVRFPIPEYNYVEGFMKGYLGDYFIMVFDIPVLLILFFFVCTMYQDLCYKLIWVFDTWFLLFNVTIVISVDIYLSEGWHNISPGTVLFYTMLPFMDCVPRDGIFTWCRRMIGFTFFCFNNTFFTIAFLFNIKTAYTNQEQKQFKAFGFDLDLKSIMTQSIVTYTMFSWLYLYYVFMYPNCFTLYRPLVSTDSRLY